MSDDVFNKSSLTFLNIANNNLTKIPTVLGFMKLLGLQIDGNPLKLIKRQVIDKGTVAIMDYLRTKHAGDPPVRSGKNIQPP
jgi:Leucine-rich repeat (LRR) protein